MKVHLSFEIDLQAFANERLDQVIVGAKNYLKYK